MRGAVLALMLLLAGCSGPAADPSSTATTTTQAASSSAGPAGNATSPPVQIQSFTLDDCTNYGGLFTVPMASAEAALPEGFTPVAAPNDPQGGARLYLIAVTCAASSVDGNATGPALVGYAELAATPSDAYDIGLSDCTVPVFFTSSNAAIAEAAGQLRLGLSGLSSGEVDEAPLSGVVATASARFERDAARLALTFDFVDQDTGSVASGSFALYGVQDGEVHSILKGTSTDGTARQGVANQQVLNIPVAEDANLYPSQGFSASGFSLSFERQPLP